ncbi:hypothetical protein D1871_04470 [Nakamurella silvestris]|nr:hypothetical protein D1871_04470 [Nakamurella silvestris]
MHTYRVIPTFQALVVALVALVPGALYTITYERLGGHFATGIGDRLVRFLAASVVFAALLSGLAYALYDKYVRSGRLSSGEGISWFSVQVVAVGYVMIPVLGGWACARALKKWPKLEALLGSNQNPRAWDHAWNLAGSMHALVRIRLKSGTWIGGLYGRSQGGRNSSASAVADKEDLFLSIVLLIDDENGEFELDTDGRVQPATPRRGILLRWDEIELIEIQEETT